MKSAKTKTSQEDKETLKYLQLAVKLEQNSLKFYTIARNRVSDFNMKTLLNTLLQNEIDHLAKVTRMKILFQKGKSAALMKEAAGFRPHTPRNPFKDVKQIDKLVRPGADIYDVFKKAVAMEQNAHDFYMEAAEHCKGSFIKTYLRKLAKDELKHKAFIESHRDAIYNDGYWMGIEHVRLET